LDNVELANQIAETERKQEILVGILKDVSAEYPQVRKEIMRRLAQITGVVEPIEIIEEASGS